MISKVVVSVLLCSLAITAGASAAGMQEPSTKFAGSVKNLSRGDIFKKAEGNKGESFPLVSGKEGEAYKETVSGTSIITVSPEVSTPVEMSSSDMNRIMCPTDIKDVVFSKEKGLTVKIIGHNAFVKFLVTKRGDKEIFSSTPSELFVACDESIYTIIAIPKRIPSQTIRLNAGVQKLKRNASLYGGMPFEKKIVSIIKSIYTDEIPESFTVELSGKRIEVFKDLGLTHQRTITVDGEGLTVKEYKAEIKGESDKSAIEVSEKDFLRNELTTRPVSLMVDRLKLKKGDAARILIVESAGRASERVDR